MRTLPRAAALAFMGFAASFALAPLHHAAHAQGAFPARPVMLIVPFSPGGGDHRDGCGGEGEAGRVYAADRERGDAVDQSVLVREAAVQVGDGVRAGVAGVRVAVRADGQSVVRA